MPKTRAKGKKKRLRKALTVARKADWSGEQIGGHEKRRKAIKTVK